MTTVRRELQSRCTQRRERLLDIRCKRQQQRPPFARADLAGDPYIAGRPCHGGDHLRIGDIGRTLINSPHEDLDRDMPGPRSRGTDVSSVTTEFHVRIPTSSTYPAGCGATGRGTSRPISGTIPSRSSGTFGKTKGWHNFSGKHRTPSGLQHSELLREKRRKLLAQHQSGFGVVD